LDGKIPLVTQSVKAKMKTPTCGRLAKITRGIMKAKIKSKPIRLGFLTLELHLLPLLIVAYVLSETYFFISINPERDKNSKIMDRVAVSGDGPFDHYTGMYKPELRKPDRYGVEYPQQGATLLANILSWGISIDEFIKQASLPGEISNLQNQVNSLQSEVEDIKGQLSQAQSMQPIYLVGGLIVGLIIGFAVAKYIVK